MSHFTVMVFGEDPEGQLAPYNENLGEECQDPKWDWYLLGGRWSGFFKAKDSQKQMLGTPGVFDNVPAPGYADALEKGNIDLEGMRADWIKSYGEKYDDITATIRRWMHDNVNSWEFPPEPKPWSYYNNLPLPIEERRELYNKSESYIANLRQAGYFFWNEDPIEDYWRKSKDEYLETVLKDCMIPYAYVKDGEWFGRGEMGWFGTSTSNMEYDEYLKGFWDDFNALPDDTMVYLYDCHI